MTVSTTYQYRFAVLIGLLIVVSMGATYLQQYPMLLGDPDTFWHIKLGTDILNTGHLPITDSYSYTYAGQPFVSKEWLSEVLFAGSYNLWGWNGVMLLTLTAAVASILLLFRDLARNLHPTIAALFAIVIIVMMTPVVVARPHILTLPIAIYFTSRMFRAAEAKQAPPFWLLALIAIWANLHGSFTLAFVIAGFACLHIFFQIRFTEKSLLAKWVAFGLLCPFAAMFHPYGFEPIRIGVQMMATNTAMAYIQEWMPLNVKDDAFIIYSTLAALAGLIGSRLNLGWAKTLFIIFVLNMMLTHGRFVYVFFLLVPIVIAPNLAERYPDASLAKWLSLARDPLESFVAKWFVPMAGAISIGAITAALMFLSHKMPAPPEDTAAEKPIAFAIANNLQGNVFNEYRYGGSLIFHGIKTFIDGRAEQLFTGDFFPDYINSGRHDGAKLFKDLIDKNKIAWTLLPNDDLRNGFLSELGWRKSYSDDKTMIYTKPTNQ
jgi:hypothetical protein